jgi:hypothetical protein
MEFTGSINKHTHVGTAKWLRHGNLQGPYHSLSHKQSTCLETARIEVFFIGVQTFHSVYYTPEINGLSCVHFVLPSSVVG